MTPLASVTVSLVLAALVATGARGQDRRTVVEPTIPPTCVRLSAELAPQNGTLASGDEALLDTARIQRALDMCPAGQAVQLVADGLRSAFLIGPIELRRGVTLLIDRGVTVFATRDPRQYDVAPGTCGVVTDQSVARGCRPLVHVVVDGAAIMGAGTIDGRGGARLLDRDVTWWDLAEQARTGDRTQQVPRLIVAERASNLTLYRTVLRNSANFHVVFSRSVGLTVWDVTIDTPRTARNSDGIDPISSSDVTIVHSVIRTGDDHVAIKAGDAGPATHMTIAHNRFYSGHGLSIGSETNGGVSAIRVTDLSIDGADNGLRIKSNAGRGGLVQDVVYEDVCIRQTKYPVIVDMIYTMTAADRSTAPRRPELRDIVLRNVRVLTPGAPILRGVNDRGLRFEDVTYGATAASCADKFVERP